MSDCVSRVECSTDESGITLYTLNGLWHRDDGPAVEYPSGDKAWYLNDQCHRTDGPAIWFADGSFEYWKSGMRHRDDGPAVEYQNGYKAWYLNGQCHRTDGPARVFADGEQAEYWLYDKEFSEVDHLQLSTLLTQLSAVELATLRALIPTWDGDVVALVTTSRILSSATPVALAI